MAPRRRPWSAAPVFRPGAIERVGVVIPARDESATIEACLRTLDHAAAQAGCRVDVVVAADSCRDDTAERALRVPMRAATVQVVVGRWGGPSPARRAGADRLLDARPAAEHARWWLANTDADGLIAADWLDRQLAHARSGALAVAGIVRLDPGVTAPGLLAAFTDSYRLDGASHAHVHAANIGLRADVYRAAGGWRARTMVGEDHHLDRALGGLGVPLLHATDVVITTSSRTAGRVVGGFASVLGRLDVSA